MMIIVGLLNPTISDAHIKAAGVKVSRPLYWNYYHQWLIHLCNEDKYDQTIMTYVLLDWIIRCFDC
jgi:hypothetical protein